MKQSHQPKLRALSVSLFLLHFFNLFFNQKHYRYFFNLVL